MIRTKGEAGSGNVVEAVRHMRAGDRPGDPAADHLGPEELMAEAKEPRRALRAGEAGRETGRLPVPTSPPAGSPPRPTPRS
jgi:pyridoxal 5'-phosphate synthase pdxS subunit